MFESRAQQPWPEREVGNDDSDRGAGFLCLAAALASGQAAPSIEGVPGTLSWRNAPSAWNIDQEKVLTIASGAKSDWFVDPFDGTVRNNAAILYFTPGSDYVLSARVNVKFATKWDAGAKLPTMRAELETFTNREPY